MFIKICGIRTMPAAHAALRAGAAALGFVAYPASVRFISAARTAALCTKLGRAGPADLLLVGVFVDADWAEMAAYLEAGVNVVQLHGREPPETAFQLRQKFGHKIREIWKVIKPRSAAEINGFRSYPADKFLFDAGSGVMPGGGGRVADWSLAALAVQTLSKPIILAGGLDPQNVAIAIRRVAPFGLDVSSGVECGPGRKSPRLIRAFIENAEEASGLARF